MGKQHGPRFRAAVDAARARVQECTVADVKDRLDARESLVLVDVLVVVLLLVLVFVPCL